MESKSIRTHGMGIKLRIGTRASELALWQANRIKQLIHCHDQDVVCQIVPIKTLGDMNTHQPISDIGGKGIFLKEIEQALVNGDVDIAVHSFKDITARPNDQLEYTGYVFEESAGDAFILFNHEHVEQQPLTLATGSLRRQALCRWLYPTIQCVPIRGNIHTRIQSAKQLGYDGIILSTAGLQRLGLAYCITYECNPNVFVPAPGQGMIAIQQRRGDINMKTRIETITKQTTNQLGQDYYRVLQHVGFDCSIPFGAYIDSNQAMHVFIERDGQCLTQVTTVSKFLTLPPMNLAKSDDSD